jgi:hypothetical protein
MNRPPPRAATYSQSLLLCICVTRHCGQQQAPTTQKSKQHINHCRRSRKPEPTHLQVRPRHAQVPLSHLPGNTILNPRCRDGSNTGAPLLQLPLPPASSLQSTCGDAGMLRSSEHECTRKTVAACSFAPASGGLLAHTRPCSRVTAEGHRTLIVNVSVNVRACTLRGAHPRQWRQRLKRQLRSILGGGQPTV